MAININEQLEKLKNHPGFLALSPEDQDAFTEKFMDWVDAKLTAKRKSAWATEQKETDSYKKFLADEIIKKETNQLSGNFGGIGTAARAATKTYKKKLAEKNEFELEDKLQRMDEMNPVLETAIEVIETPERAVAAAAAIPFKIKNNKFGDILDDIKNIATAERDPASVLQQAITNDPTAQGTFLQALGIGLLTPAGLAKSGIKGAKEFAKFLKAGGGARGTQKGLSKKLYELGSRRFDVLPRDVTPKPKLTTEGLKYKKPKMIKDYLAENPKLRAVTTGGHLENTAKEVDKAGASFEVFHKFMDRLQHTAPKGAAFDVTKAADDAQKYLGSKLGGKLKGRTDADILHEAKAAEDMVYGSSRQQLPLSEFNIQNRENISQIRKRKRFAKQHNIALDKAAKQLGYDDDWLPEDVLRDLYKTEDGRILLYQMDDQTFKAIDEADKLAQDVKRIDLYGDTAKNLNKRWEELTGNATPVSNPKLMQWAEEFENIKKYQPDLSMDQFLNARFVTPLKEMDSRSIEYMIRVLDAKNFGKGLVDVSFYNKSQLAALHRTGAHALPIAMKNRYDEMLDTFSKIGDDEDFAWLLSQGKNIFDKKQITSIVKKDLKGFYKASKERWNLTARSRMATRRMLEGGKGSEDPKMAAFMATYGATHPLVMLRAVAAVSGFMARAAGKYGMSPYAGLSTNAIDAGIYQYIKESLKAKDELDKYFENFEH